MRGPSQAREEISTWLTGTWTVQMAARRMIRAISGPHCSDDSRFSLQVIHGFTRCLLGDLMVVVRSAAIAASVVRVTSVDGKGTARG